MDKIRWVGVYSNVHDCPRKVGRWSPKCPRGQNSRKTELRNKIQKLAAEMYLNFNIMLKIGQFSKKSSAYALLDQA